MKFLTHRQNQVLEYIREHISTLGYPPTLREISGHFSLSGPRAAVKHLDALERKGFINREKGLSRGIDVILPRPGEDTGPTRAQPPAPVVPLLGEVPAGPPQLAVEDDEAALILDPSIAGEGTFVLKVAGDSMDGDHILRGDLVVVRPQETAEDGEIVVVLVGDEGTLKRYKRAGNEVHLVPSNPDHETIVLDGEKGNARIVGKVKAVIRLTGR